MDTGDVVTAGLVEKVLDEEVSALREARVTPDLDEARGLFATAALADDCADSSPSPAYTLIPE